MNENRYIYKGLGLGTKERNAGRKKFDEYQAVYSHLHKLSDLQLLEHLVFLELLDERFKNQIATISNNKTAQKSGIIPASVLKAISDNADQILNLKEKLGLFSDKKTLDAFEKFQDIMKKFDVYRKKNQLDFKCTCPFCTKIFFLKRRTKEYESFKSPFFKDGSKILNNEPLMKLYFADKLTKEEVSSVLGTSPDFIDWLDDKFYKGKKSQDKS